MMIFLLACNVQTIDSGTDYTYPSVSWKNELSLVYDGQLLHDQSVIEIASAPAGIAQPYDLAFSIHSLASQSLSLEGQWIDDGPLLWIDEPPQVLEPQQVASFSLRFDPQLCQQEEYITQQLTIPNHSLAVRIDIHCPPPLRMVLIGDHGFTLVSDDYGNSFYEVDTAPSSTPLLAQSIAWGDGVFLRAYSKGESADGVGLYQYSNDGLLWFDSEALPDYAPADCTYGLGRFVCVRADTISWSVDGRRIEHEETMGEFRLNSIVFRQDAFIAVGRGARRVRSTDALSWEAESFGVDHDTYYSMVQSSDIVVAAGGINRYFLSYSLDNGLSWSDIPYGGCPGNYIESMSYTNGLFVAQGASACHHNMHYSSDGVDWSPIVELHPFDRFTLLGTHNGYFIAYAQDTDGTHIYRSNDAIEWSKHYTLPEGKNIRHMAAEVWP